MDIIGLTGGSGSGKSTVSRILKQHGAFIIDADKIAHQIIVCGQPAYNEIKEYFGKDILDDKGNIIRKELGKIVFADKDKLSFLNKCTHKYIIENIKNEICIAKAKDKLYNMIVIDAPLLIEGGLTDICKYVVVVNASKDIRLKRIVERDNIEIELAEKRLFSQLTWHDYQKAATFIIDNSGDYEYLKKQVTDLIEKLIHKGE